MNRNLHHKDAFFKAAYQQFEEAPSPAVWQQLHAALDRKDAARNRRKMIFWKRSALLLLLLTGAVLAFDWDIWKSGSALTDKQTKTEKNRENRYAPDQQETGDARKTNPAPGENAGAEHQFAPAEPDYAAAGLNPGQLGKTAAVRYRITDGIFTTAPAKTEQADLQQYALQSIKNFEREYTAAPVLKTTLSSMNPFIGLGKNATPTVNAPGLTKSKAHAQNKSTATSFNPRWMMTVTAGYERAGYKLDSDAPENVSSIKHREAHEPSFSAEVLLTRQFTKHWGLQWGLVYENTAIGMKPQKMYAFKDPTGDISYKYITSSGYTYIKPGFGAPPVIGDSLTTAEAKHIIENISIPLAVKYTVSRKRFSVTPGAGIAANFITRAKLEVDIEDAFNREIVFVKNLSGTKSFYWSFVADAELRYRLNKKLSLTLRPVYKHALSPVTENNVVETFPHSFGIGGGISVKF